MSNWQKGDLAWFVGHQKDCPTCCGDASCEDPVGLNEVRATVRLPHIESTCGLLFDFAPVAFCSCGFVKLTPPADMHLDDEVRVGEFA